MCITFLYVNNEPNEGDYEVIIASNRDEFYRRPTKPAARWTNYNHCISGMDVEENKSGGTWLGVSEKGKIGFLLNIAKPEGPQKDKKGRGFLVSEFLKNDIAAGDYLSPIIRDKHLYNPFHLILLEKRQKKWCLYYVDSDDTETPCTLDPGFHGWCNGNRGMPWQKLKSGLERFSDILHQHKAVGDRDYIVNELMALLSDPNPHFPDPPLEEVHFRKGEDAMKRLSGIYVDLKSFQYGTRTSTLLLIDSNGCGEFIEKTMREPIIPEEPVWDMQQIPFMIHIPNSL